MSTTGSQYMCNGSSIRRECKSTMKKLKAHRIYRMVIADQGGIDMDDNNATDSVRNDIRRRIIGLVIGCNIARYVYDQALEWLCDKCIECSSRATANVYN